MSYRRLNAGELVQGNDQYLWGGQWRPVESIFVGTKIEEDYNQYPFEHMLLMESEGMMGLAPSRFPFRRQARLPKSPANPFTGKLLKCPCCRKPS